MATACVFASAPELVIDAPDEPSRRIRLKQPQYRLGRSLDNDISFPQDHRLSREHLLLARTETGWLLEDLQSRNGTKLNGTRLTAGAPLTHGDLVTAGSVRIRFDTRGEFPSAVVSPSISFVEELEFPGIPFVSVDLRSALTLSHAEANRTLEGTHLQALLRAGRELAGQGNVERLCAQILNLALDAVQATRGIVMTGTKQENLKARAARGDGLQISTAVCDLVMREGKSILVRDTRLDQDLGSRASVQMQNIRSILAVPLQTDQDVIGLLYLDSPFLVREFSEEDLNLVTVMANIAAIRIEHVRLMEDERARSLTAVELERAAEIQRGLLPAAAPHIPGFDIAGYNSACRTVGGDYYDFLPYPDGRVGICIGDVSGKGLAAALLMSSLRALVRVLFEQPEPFLDQVRRLNRCIATTCPSNCFITLFIGMLHLESGVLQYCNAGHNPPMLIHANGTAESLEATGIPLGMLKNADYELRSCTLDQGAKLVLFSDGLIEACAPESEHDFGEQGILASLQSRPEAPAQQLIEGINLDLQRFTQGAPAVDDRTVVVVRRLIPSD